mgnify:CR=1 FL=1
MDETLHTHILICDEFDLKLTVTNFDDEISWVDTLGFIAQNEINIANEGN